MYTRIVLLCSLFLSSHTYAFASIPENEFENFTLNERVHVKDFKIKECNLGKERVIVGVDNIKRPYIQIFADNKFWPIVFYGRTHTLEIKTGNSLLKIRAEIGEKRADIIAYKHDKYIGECNYMY